MSETTQSSVDYENPSELDLDLSEEDWQNLADNTTLDETNSALSTPRWRERKENVNYTLSQADFQKYFEWENFQQRNIWDCWLLSAIDSLVSFWDYEKLIRTSVRKVDKGFYVWLPLWSPMPTQYFVSFDEINTNQINISWNKSILVTWKDWIKALALAYGKRSTWKTQDFDHQNLRWWSGNQVFKEMVYWIHTYYCSRTSIWSEQKDPNWTFDMEFVFKLEGVLENFDAKTDMLTLWVSQLQEADLDRLNLPWEAYSSLWHYSEMNHEISVEKVKKNSDWVLIVTVSNPWDWSKSYDITFNSLIKSCGDFSLWTKIQRPLLSEYNRSNKWVRSHHAADIVKKAEDVRSLNQVVQLTWEADDALRKARWDIIVTSTQNDAYQVFSYRLNMNIKERNWNIIICDKWCELLIDKTKLSNKYEYNGKDIENDQYPLLLYWAKIANFINMMRNLYIDTKKRDKKNDKPFCIKDWILKFDDDPSTFSWSDRLQREWAELFWDDYIDCLNDWSNLWINTSDTGTQQKICNFLNQLVENRRYMN